jgi:hypothetical protein
MANNRRILDQTGITNPNEAHQIEHNNISGSKKVMNGIGYPTYLTAAVQASIQPGQWVAVFRNAATVGFVTLGTVSPLSAGSAPGALVIPCKPNDWTLFCVGPNGFIIGGDANTAIYLIPDSGLLSGTDFPY